MSLEQSAVRDVAPHAVNDGFALVAGELQDSLTERGDLRA